MPILARRDTPNGNAKIFLFYSEWWTKYEIAVWLPPPPPLKHKPNRQHFYCCTPVRPAVQFRVVIFIYKYFFRQQPHGHGTSMRRRRQWRSMRLSRLSVPGIRHNIAHVQWREIYLDFSRFLFLAACFFIYTPTQLGTSSISVSISQIETTSTPHWLRSLGRTKKKNYFCCKCVHIPSGTFNWIGERLIDKMVNTHYTFRSNTLSK